MAKIIVHDTGVTVISVNNEDFISLTDIARYKITLSPKKWIDTTNAIGLIAKSGRYGGTYAHKDIAFEFASWISVEFELYMVKEFQRLKAEEQAQLGWSAKRELSKINYLFIAYLGNLLLPIVFSLC